MNKQEDLINFIQNPKTISKAVEGSMDKRNALLAVPRKTLKQLPDPTKENKPTTLDGILDTLLWVEGIRHKNHAQAKQSILDLLESKAETLSTVEEKEPLLYGFVPVRAIPLTALKELGGKL
jgi:hypothetical protein